MNMYPETRMMLLLLRCSQLTSSPIRHTRPLNEFEYKRSTIRLFLRGPYAVRLFMFGKRLFMKKRNNSRATRDEREKKKCLTDSQSVRCAGLCVHNNIQCTRKCLCVRVHKIFVYSPSNHRRTAL